jgi:hypothetical protein
MPNVDNFIKSFNKSKYKRREYFIHSDTLLLINDKLPEEINIDLLKKKIEKSIPKKFFKDLDWIYVGEFPELKVREVESVYLRGAIYITNENQTEESLYRNIIHELAHSVETNFKESIYGDDYVAAEFIAKRKKLRDILKAQNFIFDDPLVYLRQEYNPQFDEFLYKTVGYDLLNQLCVGLFASPYGATSLREYFANGFEHYFLDDREYLRKTSPKLYLKILNLTKK